MATTSSLPVRSSRALPTTRNTKCVRKFWTRELEGSKDKEKTKAIKFGARRSPIDPIAQVKLCICVNQRVIYDGQAVLTKREALVMA